MTVQAKRLRIVILMFAIVCLQTLNVIAISNESFVGNLYPPNSLPASEGDISLNVNSIAAFQSIAPMSTPTTIWFEGREYGVGQVAGFTFLMHRAITPKDKPTQFYAPVYNTPSREVWCPAFNMPYFYFEGAFPQGGYIYDTSVWRNATPFVYINGNKANLEFPPEPSGSNTLYLTKNYYGVDITTSHTRHYWSNWEESGEDYNKRILNIETLATSSPLVFRFDWRQFRYFDYEDGSILVAKDFATLQDALGLYSAPTATSTYNSTNNTVSITAVGATGTTNLQLFRSNGTLVSSVNAASTTFTVTANDTYRVQATNGVTSFTVDTVVTQIDQSPPTMSYTPLTTAWGVTTSTTITLTDSTTTGLQYQYNGVWYPYTGPSVITFTANGNHTISYKDKWGQQSSQIISVNKVDPNPPNIGVVNGNPTDWTTQNVTLSIIASDTASGLHATAYSFDNGVTWQASNSKVFTTNQTVNIKVRDAVGNITAVYTVNITKIDKVAPNISVDNKDTGPMFRDITITATDSLSGLPAEPYSFDGGLTWQSSNVKRFIDNLTVTIIVRDSVGNLTSPQVISITTLDQFPPTIDSVTGNAVTWTSEDVTLVVTAHDQGLGLHNTAYSFDGGSTWQTSNSKTFNSNQTVTVMVRDKAGHTDSVIIEIKFIDKTIPEASYHVVSNSLDKATIHLALTDTISGLKELVLPNSEIVALTGTYQEYVYDVTDNGLYKFIVRDGINFKEFIVEVTEVTYNEDTSVNVTVTYGSESQQFEEVSSDLGIQLPVQDLTGKIQLQVNNSYTRIQKFEDINCNNVSAEIDFALELGGRQTYLVQTIARSGKQSSFVITLNTENTRPNVKHIVNDRNLVYGKTGYYNKLDTSYTLYESITDQDGVSLSITVIDPNPEQFLTGNAIFEGMSYPVHWNSFDGPIEVEGKAQEVIGFINIPGELIKTTNSRNPLEIKIKDRLPYEENPRSETVLRTEVATDISGPVVNVYCDDLLQLDIEVSDTTGVEDVLVKISRDGRQTWEEFRDTYRFNLDETSRYDILVTAVDYLTNTTNVGRIIGEFELDLGDTGETTDMSARVYYFKTRNARFYLINGKESNVSKIPAENFMFIDRNFK